ncbi:ubiquinol-cytochrome C chaperone [Rhizobium sp. CG5]|uniref:ubiquinol-cytochrome C chaperone family protein n=1 Tax=Rhizobium sp. CG5 TaxID=2726076 RepID=UPI0020341B4E|nr:ubiquinol-cytochrome C chaperone family protein [Rhizobium sp. CG5]MCM2473891.1 ubiquinol-cytochrome C chaperone [Rhizobium sp. CG5]
MLFGLFRQKKHNRIIVDRQYAALTALGRDPYFYTDLAVPDTVMGRLEMLSIVMILYFRRTRSAGQSGREVAQEIVDAFFQDIDYSIRELGVGDQTVPKRMKKLAGMFYGRLESYSAALDLKDGPALAAALRRNIHPEQAEAPEMADLADWVLGADQELDGVSDEAFATGTVQMTVPGGRN